MSPLFPVAEVFRKSVDPGGRLDPTDLEDPKAETSREHSRRRAAGSPREEQFVVFAARKNEGVGVHPEAPSRGIETARSRDAVCLEPGAEATVGEKVAEIPHQTVGDVDAATVSRRRQQSTARGKARLRDESDGAPPAFDARALESRTPERAGNPDPIAWPHGASA